MYKGRGIRKALDFSATTLEVKSNAFKIPKKFTFSLEFIFIQAIGQVKWQNMYIFRCIRFKKDYLPEFLEKLLEKVFHQDQKVNQESRKRGMQTQEIHHTWEAKGAPWKMVKEFTRMSTVHHKKRDTSSDRSRVTNSGDTLMAVVTKPLMCARVPSLEPQVRMSGWACSNSYLYLCCLVVQWGYCSPLHAPLPAQGIFHFEPLLREGMGVSSEAESTEQPLPWPYSILTSKLWLVL